MGQCGCDSSMSGGFASLRHKRRDNKRGETRTDEENNNINNNNNISNNNSNHSNNNDFEDDGGACLTTTTTYQLLRHSLTMGPMRSSDSSLLRPCMYIDR